MNPNPNLPPSDDELDRLLGARVRRTSQEFEMRWRALRPRLARGAARQPRARWWSGWLVWPGLATAAVAGLVLALNLRQPEAALPDLGRLEQLAALDAVLAPATPLLEPEMREAVLNLPVR